MNNVGLRESQPTLAAVLAEAKQPQWWRTVRVRDLMSTTVVCVDSLTTVPEAQALMKEYRIRRLPVIDDGELVGIITQGDVRGALPSEVTTLNRTEQAYLMNEVKVSRVMHAPVITVTPAMSLADAARLMVQHKIGGLPVIGEPGTQEAGKVIGMVTESDVFNIFVKIFDLLDKG